MRATCPKCSNQYDIADNVVLSQAAAINGRRSKRELTREQSEAMNAAKKAKAGKGDNK